MASVEVELRAENERLAAELAAAHAQQAAVADVLQSIGTGSVDLETALFDIAERAHRLLRCDGTVVLIEDGRGGLLNLGTNAPDFAGLTPAGMERLSATRVRGMWPDVAALRAMRGPIPEALRTGRTLHVWGTAAELRAQYPEMGLSPGIREETRLAVPLLRGERVLGVVTAVRTTAEPFSQSEVALLQTFATQAAIAVGNAHLLNELDQRNKDLAESLEQQTATSEILGIISTSPTELQPVFQAVVERAKRMTGSDTATMHLRDGDTMRSAAQVGETFFATLGIPLGSAGPTSISAPIAMAVVENRTIHVFGTAAELEPEYPYLANKMREAGFERRSQIAPPLPDDNAPLGVLTVGRSDGLPFSERQVALLETFAAQAVIAIKNARLFKELELRNSELAAALGRQTAMSEVLQLISRSPTNIQPVFDAIVERSAQLSGATGCRLWIAEGENFRWVALWGLRTQDSDLQPLPVNAAEEQARFFTATRETIQTRAYSPKNVIFERGQIDLSEFHQGQVATGFERGMRAALFVPLRRADATIGMLTLSLSDERSFVEQDVALVETFADQAVIAIENARLFNELDQRNHDLADALEQQTATSGVLQAISRSAFDLPAVLTLLTENAARLCHADTAQLARVQDGMLKAEAAVGVLRAYLDRLTVLGPSAYVVSRAFESGRTVHIPDMAQDPLLADLLQRTPELDHRTRLAVPLLRGNDVIGLFALWRKEVSPFSDREIALVETFASQAVIAMENARLFHEIKQKTAQLEEANAAKSQFLSTMSHELRTPLNAVIGYSELLAEDAADGGHDDMVPDLVRINAAGKHLLSLINNVLDISKIEAGKMELELQDFAVADLLAEVEAVLPPLMSRNDNRFVLDTAVDLGSMHNDKTKLRQCLLNLLSNAAKFTEAGIVTLAVRRTIDEGDDWLSFAVSDTDIGMTEEQIGRLFQSFAQAEVGTSARYGGTGLGLALSREFARLMAGDITVEGEPGEGSTFTLTVPVEVVQAG